MRWLGRLIGGLWSISRSSWVTIDDNLRPRSGASALKLFFFLIFFIVGFTLVLLGFDLDDVDHWIGAQTSWLDLLGTLVFRALGALILLMTVASFIGGLWQRIGGGDTPKSGAPDERLGWGCILFAPIIGYFAWFMMIG